MPPKVPAQRRSLAQAAASSSDAMRNQSPAESAGPANSPDNAQRNDISASSAQAHRPARLDTLNRSSIGTPAPRGRPTIARPKFSGRRSQAVRAELEREQAEQKAKETADRARRITKIRGRGRSTDRGGRPGRGRGGYVGESDRPTSIASGPFSAGQASGGGGGGWGKRPTASTASTSLGGKSGGGGAGSWSSTRTRPSVMKQEVRNEELNIRVGTFQDGQYISSDDEDGTSRATRKDVDHLVAIDLTQEGQDHRTQGFTPLRIPRQAHKARTIGLNADGAALVDVEGDEAARESAAGDKMKVKPGDQDTEITEEKETFYGTYSSSETDGELVKLESAEQGKETTTGSDPTTTATKIEPPSSPESKRKTKELVKTRSASDARLTRPLLQTQEEIEEWERQLKDLELLRGELGTLAMTKDSDVNTDMKSGASTVTDRRADKVYLFQFPPVLPDLLAIEVKPDPDAEAADDVEPPAAGIANEEGRSVDVEMMTSGMIERPPRLPAGAVGKLRIHASGKATLDWGGTSLCVSMGTEASFLQDVMITDLPDQKEGQSSDEISGLAMGMGQVKGKFVVTPNWEDLLQ